MVATRGGARTGTENNNAAAESNLALRKKPVRKAAAKPAVQEPAQTRKATTTRATRSKKVEDTVQTLDDDEAESLSEKPAQAPKTRQAAATRPRKAEAKLSEPLEEESVTSKEPSKPTRATNFRPKKAVVLSDNVQTLQPGVKARTARTTRSTVVADAAKVLSPKKVTQVSKGPLRATKSSAAKASAKPASLKVVAPPRSTRRRAASDENAELPVSREEEAEDEEDDVSVEKTKPQPRKRSQHTPVIEISSESEMSSRPTTPTESPKLDLSRTEEEIDELQQIDSEAEQVTSDDGEPCESEDELCGPKSPMKRCSPREATRYQTSPQRSVRRDNDESRMQTPVMYNGTQRVRKGTPQTQKEHNRADTLLLCEGPMTISRASNRAMVFPELTATSVAPVLQTSQRFIEKHEQRFEPEIMLEVEPEMEAGIESEPEPEIEHLNDLIASHEAQGDVNILGQSDEIDVSSDKNNEDQCMTQDEMSDLEVSGKLSESRLSLDNVEANDTNGDMIGTVDQETNVGLESTPCPDDKGMEIFDDDESVIISYNRQALEQSSPFSFEKCLQDITVQTPKPETLIWENIRQDETLVFDFGDESDLRDTLPEPDQTELLSPTGSFASERRADEFTYGNAGGNRAGTFSHDLLQSLDYQQDTLAPSGRPSLDNSIHISQFIDVQSLSEGLNRIATNHSNDMEVQFGVDTDAENVTHSTSLKSYGRMVESITPRYTYPTLSSASKRRRSLPTLSLVTPIEASLRPKTSDGQISVGQLTEAFRAHDPFNNAVSIDPATEYQTMIPLEEFVNSDADTISKTPQTKLIGSKVSSATTPRPTRPMIDRSLVPQTIAGQRYLDPHPRVPQELFRAPHPEEMSAPSTVKPPKERYPGLPSRTTYEELAQTPTPKVETPTTPETIREERPSLSTCLKSAAKPDKTPVTKPRVAFNVSTPSPSKTKARHPSLPPQGIHPKTATLPTRFRSPVSQIPSKRPASAMKASSLRNLARTISQNPVSTPIKTPLKPPGQVAAAAATTPGCLFPLTPHPSAPLKGVYALVDVWTNDASPASSAFIALLQRLGARTTKSWSKHLTHLVFKSGSPATLQRLRLHNKGVEDTGEGAKIFCVNSRWVTDCDAEGVRVDETDEELYAVDVEEACRGSKRRRKSMEPAVLVNLGDNVIREGRRKSSFGRGSIGRLFKGEEEEEEGPAMKEEKLWGGEEKDKENGGLEREEEGDDDYAGSSPVTPAYLAAPSSLVQQTAPLNKVRKLDLGEKNKGKVRRTTVWDLEF